MPIYLSNGRCAAESNWIKNGPEAGRGYPEVAYKEGEMNTKVLIFCAWMFLLALRQTADEFWLFCLIYASVLATTCRSRSSSVFTTSFGWVIGSALALTERYIS